MLTASRTNTHNAPRTGAQVYTHAHDPHRGSEISFFAAAVIQLSLTAGGQTAGREQDSAVFVLCVAGGSLIPLVPVYSTPHPPLSSHYLSNTVCVPPSLLSCHLESTIVMGNF